MTRRWWPVALAGGAWLAWVLWLPPRPSSWLVFAAGLVPLAGGSIIAARRDGTPWWPHVAEHCEWYGLALVLLYGLGVQVADAPGITTDGAIYFSQLRSLVFDRDLDVSREFAYLGQPPRPTHFVPVGPTIVWLPLYLAVAAVEAVKGAVGLSQAPADRVALGLTLPYVRAALISSFAAGAVGLACVMALLRRDFSRAAAFTATVLVFGATSLAWYMVYEASMTHAASFGAVAALVVASRWWLAPDGYHAADARRLGALAALAFLMRPQEAIFAVVPAALAAFASTVATPAERVAAVTRLFRSALVGAAPWLLLQALHSAWLVGANDFQLFGQQGYVDPWRSRWLETLFSSWHGLLSWTPIAYVATLGTVALAARQRRWAILALVLLGATAWINGSTADWAGGWSFGGRRFTSVLVMLAPGLALVIEAALRQPQWLVGVAAAAAVAWNYGLMVQYTAGMVPKDEPVSFARVIRQQAELLTRPPFVYPFGFPANVWFAWRQGLPVDRYDVLSTEPIGNDVEITMNGRAERFLLEGWDVPGGDEWGSHWWLSGSPAVIAVPVDVPAAAASEIEVTARTRFEAPAVEARLEVRVNGRPVGQLVAPAASAATARLAVPGTTGLWRRGFNRIAIVSLGVTRLDPADPSPPGEMARGLGDRPWPVAVYRLRIRSLR